jgi:acetate kinase
MQAVLVLNSGSSSIKFGVYEAHASGLILRFRGLLDLHANDGRFVIKDAAGKLVQSGDTSAPDSKNDLAKSLLQCIDQLLGGQALVAVGHRVVHGGPDYAAPVRINAQVVEALERLTLLAPLHQTACLEPIRSILSSRPDLPQVACFDTAFHHDLSPIYRRFALPLDFEARGIRRYGFHGLSFEYIARHFNHCDLRVVVAHLGGGCSLCAIHNGKSVNTTMSLTPLDGIMMATRSGALDPGLLLYLQQAERMPAAEIEDLLYHKAGLLGVSGVSGDMRALLASDEMDAKEAIDQFCARIAEQIAVMATAMNGMDMLVFTGGIGGNSPEIRRNICARLQWLGVSTEGEGEKAGGRIEVRAVPTDEESVIANHTIDVIRQT